MNLLAIARAMGGNLRRACAFSPNLLQMILDLFSSRTGRIEIFLCVALDFGLAVFSAVDFVAESMQANRKVRTINAGRILLRLEKASLLKRPSLAVLALGHIETDGVG